jgi:hypothetical protein
MDKIRVFGLTRLESLELKKQFPEAEITFEPVATKDPQHGELATAALIAVTIVGLHALTAWLVKNRKSSHIEKVVEIVMPDGTRRSEKLVIDGDESTSDAKVLEQLAKITSVDVNELSSFAPGSGA